MRLAPRYGTHELRLYGLHARDVLQSVQPQQGVEHKAGARFEPGGVRCVHRHVPYAEAGLQQVWRALTRVVAALERERRFADAIEYAQQLVRFDPLHEDGGARGEGW